MVVVLGGPEAIDTPVVLEEERNTDDLEEERSYRQLKSLALASGPAVQLLQDLRGVLCGGGAAPVPREIPTTRGRAKFRGAVAPAALHLLSVVP